MYYIIVSSWRYFFFIINKYTYFIIGYLIITLNIIMVVNPTIIKCDVVQCITIMNNDHYYITLTFQTNIHNK